MRTALGQAEQSDQMSGYATTELAYTDEEEEDHFDEFHKHVF